jgi:hypothetical protein
MQKQMPKGICFFCGESPLTIRIWLAGKFCYTIGPIRFVTAVNISIYECKKTAASEEAAVCSV